MGMELGMGPPLGVGNGLSPPIPWRLHPSTHGLLLPFVPFPPSTSLPHPVPPTRSPQCPQAPRGLPSPILTLPPQTDVFIAMELMGTCAEKLKKRIQGPIPERILGKMTVAVSEGHLGTFRGGGTTAGPPLP